MYATTLKLLILERTLVYAMNYAFNLAAWSTYSVGCSTYS